VIEIPLMTHRLSYYWKQPDRTEIILTETEAYMPREAFECLAEYSCSTPTAVYEGKMWKRQDGEDWFLGWFGPEKENKCVIYFKKICIIGKGRYGILKRNSIKEHV
jgi:hypothetical protein